MARRIAVIGCGWMSRTGHGPSLAGYAQQQADVQLVACCDLNAEAAEAYRQAFGFAQAFTDMHAMVEQAKPDALCVIVPEKLTCGIVCDLLRHRLPLMTEKPPGLTGDELDRMIAAAGDVPAMVAFNRRHQPLMVELKRRIAQAGEPIQCVRYTLARHKRHDPDFTTTAIHAIDAARHIAGEDYAQLRFDYRHVDSCDDHVTAFALDGRFASGATVQIIIEPVSGMVVERAEVFCPGHVWSAAFNINSAANDGIGCIAHHSDGKFVEVHGGENEPYHIAGGFYGENAAFCDALLRGEKPVDNLSSAKQAVAIMQAMRERRGEWQAE